MAIWVVIWCASVDYRQSNNNIRFHLRRFILCGVCCLFEYYFDLICLIFDVKRQNQITSCHFEVMFISELQSTSRLTYCLCLSLFRFVDWNGRYAYICKQTLSSSFNLICRTIKCAFKFEQSESEKIAHKWYQNSLNWLTEKCFSTKIIPEPIC